MADATTPLARGGRIPDEGRRLVGERAAARDVELQLVTRCESCGVPADAGRCSGYRGDVHRYRCTCPCHYAAAGVTRG